MDIDQANIDNLTSLWKRYDASVLATEHGGVVYANAGWPFRCWLEGDENIGLQLRATPKTHRLSTWVFASDDDDGEEQKIAASCQQQGWTLEFEQTAMYLPLDDYLVPQHKDNHRLDFQLLKDASWLDQWTEICGEAFGYIVDKRVIQSALQHKDMQFLLGFVDGEPAITALLYKTGNVMGLHQLGVKNDYQGQGLSKVAMYQLLHMAKQQSQYMVLQASVAGLPLYRKLGFQLQFNLRHFRCAEP